MQMAEEVEEVLTVTGQLLTKVCHFLFRDLSYKQNVQALLSILKHRTIEKTVDRCELSIVEGFVPTENAGQDEDEEDRDSLESRLVVRLHCKHGELD